MAPFKQTVVSKSSKMYSITEIWTKIFLKYYRDIVPASATYMAKSMVKAQTPKELYTYNY